jgi:hypothetical protein
MSKVGIGPAQGVRDGSLTSRFSAGPVFMSAQLLGWCACALMLATFCCRRPLPLRLFAVAANVAFVAYGWSADLHPVLVLHLTLLPVNLRRLLQAWRASAGVGGSQSGGLRTLVNLSGGLK